jgi:putative holliday junction resolvase
MSQAADGGTILALDIGAARVGLAVASRTARIAQPLGALPNDKALTARLRELCDRERAGQLVIGLPRGLNGQETAQTAAARTIGINLADALTLPYHWQDEAVTSVQAEAELRARGKPYKKADIDALAAVYILEDYLNECV